MITVYSKSNCPQCVSAKALLEMKNIPYSEVIIGQHITLEEFQEMYPDVRSVPLIIEDGFQIGGLQELKESVDTIDTRRFLSEERL